MADISNRLCGYPGVRRIMVTKKDLQDTLLATDGQMFYCGTLYKICSKHQNAGIYEVWLKEKT